MRNSKLHLQYMGTCQDSGKIWFVNGSFNGLFSLDIQDLTLEFKGKIPFLDQKLQWAYTKIFSYEGKLYCFPHMCKQILVYDIANENMWEVPIVPEDDSEFYTTMGIFQRQDQVWIFPGRLEQGVFQFDLHTLSLKKDLELCELFYKLDYKIYCYNNFIRLNEDEIALLLGSHTVVEVNIKTKKLLYSKCFKDDVDIWGIVYYEGSYWLLQHKSTDVYEWNKEKDILVKYQMLAEDWLFKGNECVPYCTMIFLGNEILLLPYCLRYIMRIDRKKRMIIKAADYPAKFRFSNSFGVSIWTAFAAYDIIDENTVFLHPMLGNMMLIYDAKTHQIEGKELIVTNEDIPYLDDIVTQRMSCIAGEPFVETEDMGVQELDRIIDWNCQYKREKESGNRIGKKINDAIKKQIKVLEK